VLPACDFAPFDEDGEVGVFPAFDSAALLGLPIALTSLPSKPRVRATSDTCPDRRAMRCAPEVGGSGWDAEPVEATDLRANEFGRDIVTLLLSSSSWMDDAMRAWANGNYDKVALIAPLALEHLGKAVLWRRNPVLLTPLGDNAEASLMSLATAPSLASPKLRTIGLKQVLERVETVIDGLAIVQGDKMRLVNVRNGATHVGAADASRDVLLDALTLTQTMLADLGVDPATYFGQHSRDVTALLDAKRTEVGHRVLAKRAKARQRIDQLTENLAEAGYMEAAVRLEEQRDFLVSPADFGHSLEAIDVNCPECGSIAKEFGTVDASPEVDFDVEPLGGGQYEPVPIPYWEISFTPQSFACVVCQLSLTGQAELTEARLDTETRVVQEDELGDGFDLSAFVEHEYGVDD